MSIYSVMALNNIRISSNFLHINRRSFIDEDCKSTQHIAEKLNGDSMDKNISYTEYISSTMNKNIKYVDYLAGKYDNTIK